MATKKGIFKGDTPPVTYKPTVFVPLPGKAAPRGKGKPRGRAAPRNRPAPRGRGNRR